MCADTPQEWARWLPLAEYWYNTTYHSADRMTPYEILYGQPPPTHIPYLQGTSVFDSVDRSLQHREMIISKIKENLTKAQLRMKQQADKHRSEREFDVDTWVYLKLQPYRQQSIASRPNQKLAAKYFGPYKILKRVGKVAYTLELPANARIHPTFHVFQLKEYHGTIPILTRPTDLPTMSADTPKTPIAMIDKRAIKRSNCAVVQWLIHWSNSAPEDATWEDATDMEARFPQFDPWGQGSSDEGGIDTSISELEGKRGNAQVTTPWPNSVTQSVTQAKDVIVGEGIKYN